jgi:bacterioferritin (cytochrome b1)
LTHATTVRDAIARLGGIAVTERASQPIQHTTDYRLMLEEALKTEKQSVAAYQGVLPVLREHEEELYDAIEQILFAEERSREELLQLS